MEFQTIDYKNADPDDVIHALGTLMQYSSFKRYGVIDNALENDLALSINLHLMSISGINILDISDPATIDSYISTLSSFTTEYIKHAHKINGIEDQIACIKALQDVSPDLMKRVYFEFDKRIPFIKKYKITDGHIVDCLQNLIALQYIPGEYLFFGQYFAAAIGKVRGRKKILLFLLSEDEIRQSFYNVVDVYGFSISDEHNDMVTSPIRLFLKMLDFYGYDMTIAENTKRFFYRAVVPFKFDGNYHTIVRINNSAVREGNNQLRILYRDGSDSKMYISQAYALNTTQYYRDFTAGLI